MNAKRTTKKIEESVVDDVEIDPAEFDEVVNEEEETDQLVDSEFKAELEQRLNEKFSDEPEEYKTIQLTVVAPYVHVYERVTNGGKRVGVLRQGAKVTELSRTFNWVEIQSVDNPSVRGFVQPKTLE